MIYVDRKKAPSTGVVNPLTYSPDCWYDGSDASSMTFVDTNRIEQWNDKSGNGNHLTQGTTNRRPTYNDGKVEFSGTEMQGLHWPYIAPTATHTFMFCVEGYSLIETNGVVSMLFHGTVTTLICGFGQWSNSLGYAVPCYHDGSTYRTTGFQTPLNEKMVLTYELAATTDIYYNNTLIGDALTRANQNISTSTLVVGNRTNYTDNGSRFHGAMYEFMYFNRTLSTNDRETLTNYMLS